MFGARLEILRIRGIPVRVDASWLLLAALITWSLGGQVYPADYPGLARATYWVMGAAAAVGLLISILLHELSHSLVALRRGIRIGGITLFVFGGVAEMEDEPPDGRSEFQMAIAGPIASFAIAGVLYGVLYGGRAVLGGLPPAVDGVVWYLALVNLILGGFNLLPAFPLDGGRVFRALLWSRKGDFSAATRVAGRVGLWSGTGLIVLGGVTALVFGNIIGGIWWVVIGLFLRGAAKAELTRLETTLVMKGHPVRDFMSRDPVSVPAGTRLDRLLADYVYRHHFGAYPVMDGERPVGAVGIKHLKGVHEEDWPAVTVDEVMTPLDDRMVIAADLPVMEAFARLQRGEDRRLFVFDKGRFVGIVTLNDLAEVVRIALEMKPSSGR